MTFLESLILRIKSIVKTNGFQSITGDNLQTTLVDIVQTINHYYAKLNGDAREDFAAKKITAQAVEAEAIKGGAVTANEVTAAIMQSPGYRHGLLIGKGWRVWLDENGDAHLEVDFVDVRKGLKASKLTISEVEVEGGIKMQGAAIMQVSEVVDLSALPTDDENYQANTLRLYFDSKDGRISNQFRIGDQARSQRVNVEGMLDVIYSWRVVKGKGADYIDLYKENVNTFQKDDLDNPGTTIIVNREVDNGSGIPSVGDVVVACGSTSDDNRMAYTIEQTIGKDAPICEQWSYVSDFRPNEAFNLTSRSDANGTVQRGDRFEWRTRKGTKPIMLPAEGWVDGTVANYPEQYTLDGSTYQCMGQDVTDTPSVDSDKWLQTVSRGGTGSKGTDGNSVNLLSRLPANWQRGVYPSHNGEYFNLANYACSREAIEVTPNTTHTLQRLSKNQSFALSIVFYDQSNVYLGQPTFHLVIQGNVVFRTPPTAKFARFNFHTNPESGSNSAALIAELSASQIGLYSGEVINWSPAPDDVQAEIDKAKKEAEAKAAEAKQAAKEDIAKSAGYANYAALEAVAKLGQTIIKGGYLNTSLIDVETLIADKAFLAYLVVNQLRIPDPLNSAKSIVEITASKQKFGNMEVDQGRVVINGEGGRRVELWEKNLTEKDAISGGKIMPTAQSVAAMSVQSDGSALLRPASVTRNSAYFEASVGLGFNCTIVGRVSPFNGVGEAALYVISSSGERELIRTLLPRDRVINERIVSVMPFEGRVMFSIEAVAHNHSRRDPITGEPKIESSYIAIDATTFNFTSDVNRLILAPNGYAVVNGSNDYVLMINGVKKIVSGAYDAPGVLRAGTVSQLGENQGAWGIVKAAPRRLSQGAYRITHNINHMGYFFNGTLIGGFTGAIKIINKQSSYIDVEVRGLDGNLYDCGFDYMICGNNYV